MGRSIVADSELVEGSGARGRRWRTVEEKRQIVEETLAPGASVSQVARLHGVNANQVFQWRRQYQAGAFSAPGDSVTKLLPVIVSDAADDVPSDQPDVSSSGMIHVEFPGRARVSIESGADPSLVRAVIESLIR
jgi:transposase